ncbi:MAG: PEGA domain-containing protein [Lachnospiraceae bacterium]|nr:PEGA domain-containing protein [Lachnospiraceae bacterium]
MDKICKKIYMIPVLCILSVMLTSCGNKPIQAPVYNDEVEPADEVQYFAIVSNIDEVNGKILLRSVGYSSELELAYTGGADVKDKYGDIMPMSNVELGSVVDAVYDASRNKLISLQLSGNELLEKKEGVSGAEIDYLEKTVRIDGKTYKMSNNTSAYSDNTEIGLDEICSEDQLSVWIYNNVVCSFNVELGHGYVKLVDYASYIGGMVEIGYDVIVPVTEDMLLTVREGTYTLRIAKGGDSGTKQVKVEKNKEQTVSLADIAIEPKEMGSILFHVTPSDAAVYVDRIRVNTEGAVSLVYGKHRLDIVKDGYETLSGTITVKAPYKVKNYTLTETGATTESSTSASSDTTASSSHTSTTTEKTTEADGTTETADGSDDTTSNGSKTSNKVTVSAPLGASVYLDGEFLGVAPISFTKVTGSHMITLSQTGYLSKTYTVTFTDDGKDDTLSYDELVSISSLLE